MQNIRVLVWMQFRWVYLDDILRNAEKKYGIICRDIADLGFEYANAYYSQEIMDKILYDYDPDVIFLCEVTSRNLCVDVPEDIKVISFYDHFYEQFCLFGKTSFAWIPKNNYLFIPILDAKNIDRDNALEDPVIREKLFFVPFLSYFGERQGNGNKEDYDKYSCDLSLISNYKGIEYYYGCFMVYGNTFSGRMLMRFLGEIVNLVRKEMKANESAYIADEKIQKIIVLTMKQHGIAHYIKDSDAFIKYWHNGVKYNIIPHEYGNCIVDWLIEADYNLKLYGDGWEKNNRYKKYATGVVNEGTNELRKVYQYSKINIGNNIVMGVHRRNFESMENDCLYFQAETRRDWYASDYRHYFEDGKNIVVYHNKKELYDKIDFYLSHDKEREKIKKAAKDVLKKCPDVTDILGNVIREVYEKR